MASIWDEERSLRRVDPANWLEFDGPQLFELQRDESTWVKFFTQVELPQGTPTEIHALFETARGAMVYSWFYYPLATLGMEHCFRVLELAVRIRAGDVKGKRSFEKNIERLIRDGVIPQAEKSRWDAGRSLRNAACHPNGKFLMDPGSALGTLHNTVELIGQLLPFPT